MTMIDRKKIVHKANGEHTYLGAASSPNRSGKRTSLTREHSTEQPSLLIVRRSLLPFALLILLFAGILMSCGGPQQAVNSAGTSTQDPPIPHLTVATHGI